MLIVIKISFYDLPNEPKYNFFQFMQQCHFAINIISLLAQHFQYHIGIRCGENALYVFNPDA